MSLQATGRFATRVFVFAYDPSHGRDFSSELRAHCFTWKPVFGVSRLRLSIRARSLRKNSGTTAYRKID